MMLEVQEALFQAKRPKGKAGDRLGLDCYLCQSQGLREARLCWLDDEARPVEVCGVPLVLTKQQLRAIVPMERWRVFLDERVRSEGRPVCPVALAMHPDVGAVLEMEGDLKNWHQTVEPVQAMPMELVGLLRHVRREKGRIQLERGEG